jgi:hypothetical protein
MTNTTVREFLLFSALLFCGVSAKASDAVEVPWKDFCRVAGGRQIQITTSAGETVSGYCMTISADEVGLRTPAGIVKIGRAALSHIEMDRAPGHLLASLGGGVRAGLKQGNKWLLSPQALLGVVTIPSVLAWGAVSTPFCVLGDLKHRLLGKTEVSVK